MRYLAIVSVLLGLFFVNLEAAAEKKVGFTDAQVAEAVKKAPKLPIYDSISEDFEINVKLVDFIDFTDPNDFHDLFDRGTSKIEEGPAGKYRVTAAHRHSLVSVRWKADEKDKPHLLVWEYPDDAERQICFFTHESKLSGRRNIDWSLETGVNCGHPLPLTNNMQYHTFFFWPTDNYPVAMYMNWARNKVPAAASRLWVYRVEGDHLPPLQVEEPDPENPRIIGGIHNWSLVPTKGIFGLNRGTVMDHIAEYHAFRGDNIISWPVVSNNTWGFRCKIPSWDGGNGRDTVELEQILAACEKHKIKFMPVFNTGIKFKMKGKDNKASSQAERRANIEQGFKEFINTYGKSKALYGIAFETQDLSPKYTECSLDEFRKSFGSLKAFSDFMKSIAPDLELYHYLGSKNIHAQYFYDGDQVFKRWEDSKKPWSEHLAGEVNAYWKTNQRDPKELANDGIHTVLSYQSDDYKIFDTYYQNPRAMTYWDLEASQARSDLFDTRKALIWNTFYEGYIGLAPTNWLYLKVWVAPDFNPAGPHALAAWMQSMQHRDRDMLLFGAWNNKGAGIESKVRKMAKAFRSLPPTELKDVAVIGDSPVKVRSTQFKGKTYVNLVNNTTYAHELSIGSKKVMLSPYTMETLILDGKKTVKAKGKVNADYVRWLNTRLDAFYASYERLRALDKSAVPAAYLKHYEIAKALCQDKKYYAADNALGHGVQEEINLRISILKPRELTVPKHSSNAALTADLNAWPKQAADWKTESEHIGTHLFFPNLWHGDKDLGARIRCFHDGETLHFGIAVSDQTLTAKDACAMYFSGENYLKYATNSEKYESNIAIGIPRSGKELAISGKYGAKGKVTKTKAGYTAVFSVNVKELPLKDKSIGWLFMATDEDNNKHLNPASWARKQVLMYPNDPNFPYWSDARTCVRLILDQ